VSTQQKFSIPTPAQNKLLRVFANGKILDLLFGLIWSALFSFFACYQATLQERYCFKFLFIPQEQSDGGV